MSCRSLAQRVTVLRMTKHSCGGTGGQDLCGQAVSWVAKD